MNDNENANERLANRDPWSFGRTMAGRVRPRPDHRRDPGHEGPSWLVPTVYDDPLGSEFVD